MSDGLPSYSDGGVKPDVRSTAVRDAISQMTSASWLPLSSESQRRVSAVLGETLARELHQEVS
jgi:hypothetical protein